MALLLTTTTLPGLLTKTTWFVTISQTSRLIRLSTKSQTGATNCSAYAKTSEKVHTPKVKHTQTKQSERREIVSNRNEYAYILSIYPNDAKITRYSMSNNKA